MHAVRSWFLGVMLAGCAGRDVVDVPDCVGTFTWDNSVSADLDLLFVIDNASSTLDKQGVFAQSFPKFVDALDHLPAGRPNLHIGVVTTSVELGVPVAGCAHPDQDGLLQSTPGLGAPAGCTVPSDRFLSDVAQPDGTRLTNYTGQLADTLSCIASVGAQGCGFISPLEAMKRALDDSHPENAGFMRSGSSLGVVILVDEDDCSAKPGADGSALFTLPVSQAGAGAFRCTEFGEICDTQISTTLGATYTNCKVRTDSFLADPNGYAGFLGTVKDPNHIFLALIAGDPSSAFTTVSVGGEAVVEPSCSATVNGGVEVGLPSFRLSEFVGNFGDHGLFQSVCQADYSTTVANIGALLFHAFSPCLLGNFDLTDADPTNPGIQLACRVVDVQNLATPMQTETPLPACTMLAEGTPDPASPTPCWYTVVDPICSATDTMRRIALVRGDTFPPTGTVTQVNCASLSYSAWSASIGSRCAARTAG